MEGEAFGTAPAGGTLGGQQKVSGFLGKGLVNTFLGGDRPQGKLISPVFTITRRFLSFLIGGGDEAGKTCINLRFNAAPLAARSDPFDSLHLGHVDMPVVGQRKILGL